MIAYFNGQYIDSEEIKIPVSDVGFTMGVTVTERFRTYASSARFLDLHIDRFRTGLEIVGIRLDESIDLGLLVQNIIRRNDDQLESGDDFEISMFATPGISGCAKPKPTLGIVLSPVRFALWSNKYETGESIAIVSVCETESNHWPRNLKCRSRMHYWLADQEANAKLPGSKPLLLNQAGNIAESSTGLVVARLSNRIIAPPADSVLPSISFSVALDIFKSMKMVVVRRDIDPAELLEADEVLLFSSPYFVLPVTQIDGNPIGNGQVGTGFTDLIERFSNSVGVQMIAQAKRFANRQTG